MSCERIPTGSQTVGPFFNYALTTNPALGVVAKPGAAGEHVRVEFRVLDGDGNPTPGDSMIEIWQADSNGRYGTGFGRLETDANGVCVFETVKPGRVNEDSAPFVHVIVFARGLLKHLYTRMYFAGDPANESDPALQLVPVERRHTLLAVQTEPGYWRMTIRLQGDADSETVFFEL
jgi:protocatechuate 3,4-dioxygenase, alpha subunit